jgi:hypothetical protein
MMANKINFEEFFQRFQVHRESASQVKGKSLVLMIGGSGVGKSAFACFLIGRRLIIQEERKVIKGKIRTDSSLVPFNPQPDDFVVGHGSDAGTKSIHALPLFRRPQLLVADTCGFWDPEGFTDINRTTNQTVNIVNAVGLRFVMGACSDFRAILLINVSDLENRSFTFSQFISLLLRFFNPISSFFQSMIIYFRPPNANVTDSDVNSVAVALDNLAKSNALSLSEDHLAFVDWIAAEVESRGTDIFFVYDPPDEARENIIQRILNTTGYTESYALGCPLSNESMESLCNQVNGLAVETISDFRQQQYHKVHMNITWLNELKNCIESDEITSLCDKCLNEIAPMIDEIQNSATKHFNNLEFRDLQIDLISLREARVIKYFQLDDDFQERVLKLNEFMETLGSEVLDRLETSFESLNRLYQMKLYLSNFLHREIVTNSGYDAVCAKLSVRVFKADRSCSEFLSSLKQALNDMSLNDPIQLDFHQFFSGMDFLRLAMTFSEHIRTKHPQHSTAYDSLLIKHREELTDQMILLSVGANSSLVTRESEAIHARHEEEIQTIRLDRGPDMYEVHLAELRNLLDLAKQSCESLVAEMRSCSEFSSHQQDRLSYLHSVLRECFQNGASGLFIDSPELNCLNDLVVEQVIQCLGSHLSRVDLMYLRKDFLQLTQLLKVLTLVQLKEDKFILFKTTSIEPKIHYLVQNLLAMKESLDQQLDLLPTKKFLEESDLRKVVDDLSMLKSARCLDQYLFDGNIVSHLINEDSSLSRWYETAIHSLGNIWSTTLCTFTEALNSTELNRSHLVRSFFDRLDHLAFAIDFLSSAESDLKNIDQKLDKLVTFVVSTEPTIPPFDLVSRLRCFDVLIGLLAQIEDCKVINQIIAFDPQRCSNYRRALSLWLEDVQQYVDKKLQQLRQDVKSKFTALDAKGFTAILDEMREFCCLSEHLQPNPSLLYQAALNDMQSCIQLKCRTTKQSSDVLVLDRLRTFISNSYLFQGHFGNIQFDDYMLELNGHHHVIVDGMLGKVTQYLEEKRYTKVWQNLKMLKSSSDPAAEDMLVLCNAEVSTHLKKIQDAIFPLNDNDVSAPTERIDCLIKLFENCHEVMVMSEVISYKLADLMKAVATNIRQLFLKIKEVILDDLNQYNFSDALSQYIAIERFRKCDLQYAYYPNLPECACFGPDIDDLKKTSISSLPDRIVRECKEHCNLKLEEMKRMDSEGEIGKPEIAVEDFPDSPSLSRESSLSSSSLGPDDVSYLIKLLVSLEAITLFKVVDRQIGFDKVKGMVTRILQVYANKLVKTLQDQIYHQDFKAAKIRAKAGKALMAIPCIAHYLGLDLMERVDAQCKSLAAAEKSGSSCSYQFDAAEMPKIKKHLQEQKRKTFELYEADYLKFKERFILRSDSFMEQIAKETATKEIETLVQFMTALCQYDDTIVDPKIDNESSHIISNCRKTFDSFLSREIRNCHTNLAKVKDVKLTYDRVLALRLGLELLARATTNATNKQKLEEFILFCTRYEAKGVNLLKEIEKDINVLGSHDLFAREEMGPIIERLERLRHNNIGNYTEDYLLVNLMETEDDGSYDTIKANLESQLSTATERIQIILSNQHPDYECCVNGIINIRELAARFSPLKELGLETCEKILSHVTYERNRIAELVAGLFRNKNFKILDNTISLAAAMDEGLLKKISWSAIPLLMAEVADNIVSELTFLTDRMSSRNASVEDHADLILAIKECVSEINQSQIKELANNHIEKYLEALAKRNVNIYQLGTILSKRGSIGLAITEDFKQFQAVREKRRNQLTSHITLEDAVAELLKLNQSLAPTSGPELIRLGHLFSEQYEAALKNYLPGYGLDFTCFPLSTLAQAVRRDAHQSRRNPSPENIISILSGIFATWTVQTSSEMFRTSSYDPDCIKKPHPIQLITIFRLLGIDSVNGFWTSFYRAAGIKQKILKGHLAQVR